MKPVCSPRGFTLIELMITVVIVGILAAFAIGGISRMIVRSRKAEIGAVFAAFATGEEAFKSESGNYVALSNPGGTPAGSYDAAGAPDNTFYPALTAAEPKGKAWQAPANPEPATWLMAAFNYPEPQMYCGYSGNAGAAPGNYPSTDAEWGPSFPANYPANGPWYYVAAECKWDNNNTTHYIMRYDQVGTVINIDGD